MATIIARRTPDYGGELIWVAEDTQPIYAAPHVTVTDKWLDDVLAQRAAVKAEETVDAMYQGYAERAAAQVNAIMETERAKPDYDNKTAQDVANDIATITDPWAEVSVGGHV